MDELIILTEEVENSGQKFELSYKYDIFAKIKLSIEQGGVPELNEILLPKIDSLSEKNLIRKDLFLLSLLAGQKFNILKEILRYERNKNYPYNDFLALYHSCVFNNEHWIKMIQSKDFNDLKGTCVSDIVLRKIIMLKCLDLTVNNFNVDEMTRLLAFLEELENDDESQDELLIKLKSCCDIIQFYKSIKPNGDEREIFCGLQKYTLLNTFSTFLELKDSENWAGISQKLESNGVEDESDIFRTFMIFARILQMGKVHKEKFDSVKYVLDDISHALLEMENILDLLEDIFALLFLTQNDKSGSGVNKFQNKEVEIRSILHILRKVVDELIVRGTFNGHKSSERFRRICCYVDDACWRFDLFTILKEDLDININAMYFLLSHPVSLLTICMRHGNFYQAYRVIEVFSLKDSGAEKELLFAERVRSFRKRLGNIESRQKHSLSDALQNEISDVMLVANVGNFSRHRSKYHIVMDVICTEPLDNEVVQVLFQLINQDDSLKEEIISPCFKFYQDVFDLYKTLGNVTIPKILSSSLGLNEVDYKKKEEFDEKIISLCDQFKSLLLPKSNGGLNMNHQAHILFGKIESVCNNFLKNYSEDTNYLRKLFNYLKAFSRIFYIEKNTSGVISKGKNTSFFELLNYNRSEVLGNILFEKHLDPADFAEYFSKMKLDFLYHLIGNCFPTVNLETGVLDSGYDFFPENKLYVPSHNIINYLMKRNLLLALILEEMYNISNVERNASQSRIQAFINYRNLKTTKNLKCIFGDNEVRTSLQHQIPIQKIKRYMDDKNLNFSSFDSNNSEPNRISDWWKLFEVMRSVPEIQMKKFKEMRDLRDSVTCYMINLQQEYAKLLSSVFDSQKRVSHIIDNYMFWAPDVTLDLIKAELSLFTKEKSRREELRICQQKTRLFEGLMKIFNLSSWNDCRVAILGDMDETIKILIESSDVNLILLFIREYNPSEEMLKKIDTECILNALGKDCQLSEIHKLLDIIPTDQAIVICQEILKRITNLDHLNFFYKYLVDNSELENLRQIQLSLKLFSKFSNNEREKLSTLITDPLSIIEVLLMNAKFDKLMTVFSIIKEDVDFFPEEIDELLRVYAEKSLDFRFIIQPFASYLKTEWKLLESIDSSSNSSEKRPFFIPLQVPTKEEWVKDDQVLECMCCRNITFSIFNRKHHCRRCGRLVCYMCSSNRMKVSLYGHILVRVCIDCYKHTESEFLSSDGSEKASVKSISEYSWLLSPDEEYNKSLREEFSYDQAPSVFLCLSILKYHSNTIEHPIFLLNQCEKMLKVLYSLHEVMQETDYFLVIRMIKSLAMAAKLMSQEGYFHQCITLADKFLNQTELLSLFSERSCLSSLPAGYKSETANIDIFMLRRLRDNLLDKEEWNSALQISTKAGLDSTVVFAAWGKSCLKAGCLTKAREKFHRCFTGREWHDHVSNEDSNNDDDSIDSSSRNSEKRPLKNPPLLNDIINILEAKSAVIDKHIVDEVVLGTTSSMQSLNQNFSQKDPAVSILNKLRNLDHIALGKYYFSADRKAQSSCAPNRPMVDTLFYNECIFYLSRYGSHQSLLEFYLKHGELDQALQYVLDYNMNTEVFIEIYVKCLKDGVVNSLQENMSKIDPTLDLWENYLRQLCRYLEQQNLLHSLYQLQVFMGDYMRAAMTCIRFYHENTHNFNDLARKNYHLHRAEEHIKQIYALEQWTDISTGAAVGSSRGVLEDYERSLSSSLVLRTHNKNIDTYLNIIWRQNEVASFLADCEAAGLQPMNILATVLSEDSKTHTERDVPTLFGSYNDQIRLAVLILVTSAQVKAGFKIVSRIIQDFKLRPNVIYINSAKLLAKMNNHDAIEELIQCIKVNAGEDEGVAGVCDEVLSAVIAILMEKETQISMVKNLIKLITDPAIKISAYIEAKQLKTAYIYAVRYKRLDDIERISREAELNNEPSIKALCVKILSQNESSAKDT